MASLMSNMAKEVFQILKGSGRTLSLYDEHSNKVFEPDAARSIFSNDDKLMISIDPDGSDSSLNMYISKSADVDAMRQMIDNLRTTATRYNFLFNVRKYGKDLQPKDFAFKAAPMMESMWGTGRTSYQNVASSKLIVKHNGRIEEEKRGARSRRIGSIFVETANGERFRCPVNSLTGARAYAKHLSSGGTPGDSFSNFIFAECEQQAKINRVRRHIRRLGEGNEKLTEVSQALTQWVQESKRRITRSKGERFYIGIIETINSNPNQVQALQGEINECVGSLAELMGLDESDSLYPILEDVAKTILGSKLMDHINFEEERNLRTYMSESAEALDDLVESLEGEFGLVEGEHFTRSPVGVAILDDASADAAHMYAEAIDTLVLGEAPENKFYTYAKQWLSKRADTREMPELNTPEKVKAELEKQASELGIGLQQVVAGALNVKIKGGAMPKFTNQNAAIAFKLDKLLAPGSGLGNDMLWNFVSALSDKISHGDSMDNNEKFFATKLAGVVDAAVQRDLPETLALEQWAMEADMDDSYRHADDYAERGDINDEEMEQAIYNFNFEDFMQDAGSDFEGYENGTYMDLDPDDRVYTRDYVGDMAAGYLARQLNVSPAALGRFDYMIADLVDETIIPALEQLGFTFDGVDESFDASIFEDVGEFLPDRIEAVLRDAVDYFGCDMNYMGIISGDDRDEDTYNFIRDVVDVFGPQLEGFDLYDHVNEVAGFVEPLLRAASEAQNGHTVVEDIADDLQEKEEEVFFAVQKEIPHFVANPPQGSNLAIGLHDFVGEDTWTAEALSDVVAEDLRGIIGAVYSDHGYIEGYEDAELSADMMQELSQQMRQEIVKRYNLDATLLGEGELSERHNPQAEADRMNLSRILKDIESYLGKGNSPEEVYAYMQEYYMDSRAMGPVVHQNKDVILDALRKAFSLREANHLDMGDDFKSDIEFQKDEPDLEEIKRLRKLAGI